MRVFALVLAALMVALGTALSACGEDEQQQEQPTVEQADQQAQQAEQQRETAATAQRAAEQQSTAERDAQTEEQDESTEARQQQTTEAVETDPLLAEARSAFDAWVAELESFEIAIEVDLNLGGLATQIATLVAVRLEPFMALTTIDASSLVEMMSALGGEEPEEPDQALVMNVLISEDSAYLSMPEIDGWIDLSDQIDETLGSLTAMLGSSTDDFTNPNQLGQAFGCVDAVGGSAVEEQYAGEAVWFVECEIDVESLNDAAVRQLRAAGIEVGEAGIESMSLRLAISQETGAPLQVVSTVALRDAFGVGEPESDDGDEDQLGFYVSTVANLVAWNEPIEFPTPEPLVDASILEDFSDSDSDPGSGDIEGSEPPELLSPEELLELASIWVATSDELHVQFAAQAMIDGEARLASTIVRSSRLVGAFETTVNIDDASTFRLLWNRDGIWTSDSEEGGEPVWAPSTPALLGFAGMTVDEFLNDPDRFNLGALEVLLDISWTTRTISGGAPPLYELVIESGPLSPGEARFDQVAEILKADTAELLAESVVITGIDHYSTVVTIVGDDGAVTGRVSRAAFETSAGRVDLVASLDVISDGPIEFSRPPE